MPEAPSSTLRSAELEFKAGRFMSALHRLRSLSALSPAEAALYAECCEMCGLWEEAEKRAQNLCHSSSLQLRARGKAVLGALASLTANPDKAEANFRESRALLRQAGEQEKACEIGIRQFAALLDMRIGASVENLASELQREVSRFQNRRLLCMFHVAATNFHGSTGRIELAKTHAILANSHLKAEPNPWLGASLSLAESGIAFMEGNLEGAVRHAMSANRSAEESGHLWCRAASATTCAFLSIRIGQARQAEDWITVAKRLSATIPVLRVANLDNVGQLCLLRHDAEGTRQTLALLQEPSPSALENSWYGLPIIHTRIRLYRTLGNWVEVERLAVDALKVAETRSDPNFVALFAASWAEALGALGKVNSAVAAIGRAFRELNNISTSTISEIDRALAIVLRRFGVESAAARSARRASHIAALIHDAVLAEEAKHIESTDPTYGHDVFDSILQLWQFATSFEDPEALLPSLFSADELKEIVSGVELIAERTKTALPGDGHILELEPPQSGRQHLAGLLIQPHATALARLGTLILAASTEAILFRSRKPGSSRRSSPEGTSARSDFLVSPSMLQLLDTATRISSTSITVLITGETGTGKEVLARFIHEASDRKSAPFVAVNCSALSRELLESTLFGHRRGAFTGASESFDGLVKGAEGGTLFLDEVGDLPLDLQPKFLRFLEMGEVLPLGTNQPTKVNVRVLAATNANLSELVANGRFRADLFYRLNGIHFQLPPLRSRRAEIPELARHLLEKYAEEFGKGELTLAPEAFEHLLFYDWPGNVRQLASELRRVAVLAEPNSAIEAALLSDLILAGPPRETTPAEGEPTITVPIDQNLEQVLGAVERTMIMRALERSRGRVDVAARLLGISRKGLFLKRRRHGIPLRQS